MEFTGTAGSEKKTASSSHRHLKRMRSSSTFPARRVLVVDDDAGLRSLIRHSIEKNDFRTDVAGSVLETRAMLRQKRYAAVLVDLMLPDGRGEDVVQMLSLRYPDTAVVVMTGIDDARSAISTIKAGADDYLVKPVDAEVLKFSIERAIERRRDSMELDNYRQHLEERTREYTEKIQDSFINVVTSMAEALEAKDPYTKGHSLRVARYAKSIVMVMGGSESLQEDVYRAGLVHDIGKIGTSEEVLHKPGKLTDEEYEHIKQHPVLGVKILKPVLNDNIVLEAVRHHHERVDGKGYPDGLKDNEIPFAARILAVADAYDAMTSDRPYRSAMPKEKALSIIREVTGTQLSPRPVRAFFEVIRIREGINHV